MLDWPKKFISTLFILSFYFSSTSVPFANFLSPFSIYLLSSYVTVTFASFAFSHLKLLHFLFLMFRSPLLNLPTFSQRFHLPLIHLTTFFLLVNLLMLPCANFLSTFSCTTVPSATFFLIFHQQQLHLIFLLFHQLDCSICQLSPYWFIHY